MVEEEVGSTATDRTEAMPSGPSETQVGGVPAPKADARTRSGAKRRRAKKAVRGGRIRSTVSNLETDEILPERQACVGKPMSATPASCAFIGAQGRRRF